MKIHFSLRTVCIILVIMMCACSKNQSPEETLGISAASLKKGMSYRDVTAHLQDNLIAGMDEQVDKKLETALENDGYCWPVLWGGGGGNGGVTIAFDGAVVPEQESATDYSETNVQVAGVDEADFIKNDGSYIYILADGAFQIIDAWPPQSAEVISSTPLDGIPKKLFVHGNKALIYSSIENTDDGGDFNMPYHAGECTYGYDCSFEGDGMMLHMTLFDIEDKVRPKLLRETRFSGSYLNSRRIGQVVYTVVIFPEIDIPDVTDCPGNTAGLPQEEIIQAFESLKTANRRLIRETDLSDYLPHAVDIRYSGGETIMDTGLYDDFESYYVSPSPDGRSFLSVVACSMDTSEPLSVTTILAKPGAVYANSGALYLATRQNRHQYDLWYYPSTVDIDEASTVHKFNLDPDSPGLDYAGSGVIKGRVLNQFSMDEKDGYLRIATTTGHVPSPDVHSTLMTLKESGGELTLSGSYDNIAPTEDIRSVRFNGDTVFIVTFKKVDPLFAFDLSDPEHPSLKGELKIPGYSTYMHMMDETTLLTIGYDAEDHGSYALFQGIMLQIFDVSDTENPALMHKDVIGTRGTSSEAALNHLAFNYFAAKNLLALPMVICEEGSEGSYYGDDMSFSGLMLYRVTPESGFSYIGGISHVEPETEETYDSYCYNWWTEADTLVQRSVIMSGETTDYVFSVAADTINVGSINGQDELSVVNHIDVTDKTLQLVNKTWRLTGFKRGDDSEEILVTGGNTSTLYFNGSGVLTGSILCNSFTSEYTVNENVLSIDTVAPTEMYCGPDDVGEAQIMIDVLSDEDTLSFGYNRLTLYSTDNSQLTFQYEED